MTTPNTPPPPPPQTRFFEWVGGFAAIIICHTLIKTGVIEQMRNQPHTVADLAETCHLNRDVLFRTLRMTTALDLTTTDGERFALTNLGQMLLKDMPGNLHNSLLLMGSEPWQRPWQNFGYCLTNGENAFERVMGAPFFDYLDQHPEYGIPFHQMQTAYAATDSVIVAQYDFSPFRTVCDIGGGHGNFLKTILEANPHLKGILFDQASVVQDHLLGALNSRVEIVVGSFFEDVPQADVLVLKAVLHDWSNEKCAAILSNCRKTMRPDGRLLVVDRVIDEPVDPMSAFYDLHMLVMMSGRERSVAEFRELFESTGFHLLRIIPTPSPLRIVEASA